LTNSKHRFYVSPGKVILLVVAFALVVAGLEKLGLVSKPAPTAPPSACSTNWTLCVDNADLVNNNRSVRIDAKAACTTAANERARYGTPVWPSGSFDQYIPGNDYITTGRMVLREDDVKFQNGFGVLARTSVTCTYDLRSRQVVDLKVS
jgi:hypothetical protein